MARSRTIFRHSLLRIIVAMFIFEILVGSLAYIFLMLPVLENHARNFAQQISKPQADTYVGFSQHVKPPADGGQSWLPFNLLLAGEIEKLSGHSTSVRNVADQPNYYWLPVTTTETRYLVFDHRAVVGAMPTEAFVSWFTLALIAGLAIATWLARGISRPIMQLRQNLQILAQATPQESALNAGILELDELRLEFATLTRQLALAIDDRTTLLLGLSHELSAPVARLTMAFELYAKHIESNKREDIQADLDEMRRIIEQFLSAARCLHPQEQQRYSLTHLMDWLRQRYAQQTNVQVDVPLQEIAYTINATALERILINLIDNALRHASPGIVTVQLDLHPGQLELAVSDNGPGIPEDEIPRLFHPFEKRAASQGVGLGLALSRLLAEQNGWTLKLSKLPTSGLQATLLIPLAAA